MVMMDPTGWDVDEVRRALTPDSEARATDGASGVAAHVMVVGSTGPFASLSGRKALQAGGSAVDAVITTALAPTALAAGSWVSYAGVFCLVHHRVAGETDSLSASPSRGSSSEPCGPSSSRCVRTCCRRLFAPCGATSSVSPSSL
jgi:hypothetical protein